MAYNFIKMSATELMEEATGVTNVLVEENGDVKRVPKSKIGAQADWNETDDTNPAYILNKPESLGGYAYYEYYGYYMYKCADRNFVRGNERATQNSFENDYYNCPIMLKTGDGNNDGAMIVYYDNYNNQVGLMDPEYGMNTYSIEWA